MANDTKLTFHFIKSPGYQEIVFHGGYGGVTPDGERLSLALYSERAPLPQQTTHALNADSTLSDELVEQRIAKADVVRVVSTVVYMDKKQALGLRAWLDEKILELERTQDAAAELKTATVRH